MPANNAPELPVSMRLKGRMAQMMQGVGRRLLPMQDFLVALLNLIHTLRTTRRNPLNIPAQNAAQPAQTPPLALAGGAETAALPPGRNTESHHPTIAVPAVEVVDGELVIEDDMTPEREFTRVKLERTYAMPDDVHAPAVRALEAAFADSAIGQTAANDNTFGQVGRAVAGISPAAAQGGGRGNDGNADQALNAPENSSDLAKRLSEIAKLAEYSHLEAVSAMRELMKQEALRLDDSWPQIARAAEENPRLRSVLDTAIVPTVRQSASNE